jgi:hypothetical protein
MAYYCHLARDRRPVLNKPQNPDAQRCTLAYKQPDTTLHIPTATSDQDIHDMVVHAVLRLVTSRVETASVP